MAQKAEVGKGARVALSRFRRFIARATALAQPTAGTNRIKGGVPSGIRTRVTGVKGRRPGPLDDGDKRTCRRSVPNTGS
jgi:hypothetical protein